MLRCAAPYALFQGHDAFLVITLVDRRQKNLKKKHIIIYMKKKKKKRINFLKHLLLLITIRLIK